MTASFASPGMERALAEAAAAGKRGEVPVGAAVTDASGAIVAAAGNRTVELNDPSAHAEVLAIRQACASLGNDRLTGHDLYVTLEPCAMCAGLISFARLRRLYYGAEDEKMGAIAHGPRLFTQPTCHHRPEVYGGIRAEKAGRLLRSFFQARRKER